jgi:sulfatase maturation enzyme AslB (radical SAM superfamily)
MDATDTGDTKNISTPSFEKIIADSLSGTGWILLSADNLQGSELRLAFIYKDNAKNSLNIYLEKRDDAKPCFGKTEKYNVLVPGNPGEALPAGKIHFIERFIRFLLKYEQDNPSDTLFILNPTQETQIKEYAFSSEKQRGVVIILKARCSWKCCFCRGAVTRSADNKEEEHADLMQRLLKLSEDKEIASISITGNEPLNHPHIVEIINFCAANFRMVLVPTSGVGLNRKSFFDSIKEPQKIIFTVPLYGDVPEIHDAITGSKGSFNEIASVMENKDLNLRIETLILQKNAGHLREIYEFCADRGRRIEFTVMYVDSAEDGKKIYKKNAPRFSDAISELRQFLNEEEFRSFLVKNRLRIPICLPGVSVKHETIQARTSHPDGSLFRMKLNDVDNPDQVPCRHATACAAAESCPGIFGTYIEMYGWDEFKPIV